MFLIVVSLLLASGVAVWAQPADLLLKNGNIYTLNPAQPKAKAIAMRGDRIVAIGDGLESLVGPKTRVIDLGGGAVVPGLIDSHVHLRGLGALLESVDLRQTPTVAEVAKYVSEQARRTPKGEWITGRNWDQTNWGGQFPTAADLDKVARDHPVYLTRVDGHAGWANSKALQMAAVNRNTPDPPGGKILKDAKGEPTGILVDRAMGLVRRKIPPAGDEQVRRQLALAAKECARLGLSSVHDAGITEQDLAAYRSLVASGEFPLRVYAMIGGEGALWNQFLEKGPEIGPFLTVRSIKLVADGALGSRGASLWQGYSDEKENAGLLILKRAEIERISRTAASKGFQVATHAIGDRANRETLDAYAAVLNGKNDKRFRIEHAQVVALPDFRLFADHSVIASVQATHATSDMRWAEERLGPDRIAGAYAWRRFLDLKIPLANGSDSPVEQPNPMLGFYSSVSRQDLQGNPPGGWTPGQKLTREEALYSWTMAGAYVAFEEQEKGSLQTGKLADLVVLSQDIMTIPQIQIPATKVRMTVVGGRVVYEDASVRAAAAFATIR